MRYLLYTRMIADTERNQQYRSVKGNTAPNEKGWHLRKQKSATKYMRLGKHTQHSLERNNSEKPGARGGGALLLLESSKNPGIFSIGQRFPLFIVLYIIKSL